MGSFLLDCFVCSRDGGSEQNIIFDVFHLIMGNAVIRVMGKIARICNYVPETLVTAVLELALNLRLVYHKIVPGHVLNLLHAQGTFTGF